jgi:hypothetical protein
VNKIEMFFEVTRGRAAGLPRANESPAAPPRVCAINEVRAAVAEIQPAVCDYERASIQSRADATLGADPEPDHALEQPQAAAIERDLLRT